MLKKLGLITVCAASAFAMHTAEININDKDLEVSGQFDIGQFNDAVEPNTMFVGAKFLNADEKNSDNDNANLDPYFEVSFLMMKEMGDSGFKLGLGGKLNYTENFSALPLGVEGSYKIPADNLIPMYINAAVYYAPSVLSFSDADSYFETRINYDIEVIDNGKITLGYRKIDTNYDNLDFTYNNSWYVGFKFSF
jgi:hypothetical protein